LSAALIRGNEDEEEDGGKWVEILEWLGRNSIEGKNVLIFIL
jgi:hypothetical protein